MNHMPLQRVAPRTSLLAAAVLSSLAMADTTPDAKKAVCVYAPPDLPIDHAVAMKILIGSTMNGHLVTNVDARTILAGNKQRGPRYGAGKKIGVTAVLSHEFGDLPVAHHREPLATAGMKRRGEHLLVN